MEEECNVPMLKIENADVQTSAPYIFDVMDARGKCWETHVLKFGDFIMVGSLDNLRTVRPEDKAKRDADEALAAADELERSNEEQRSVRAAKAFADAATRLPPKGYGKTGYKHPAKAKSAKHK